MICDVLAVSIDYPRENERYVVVVEIIKASISSADSQIDSWVLNSGASFHTTTHQSK